ncbi:MAG TPA: hypothetical protein VGN52_06830 [Burkholderiales bacterium]|jgi:hypothetical protein
MKPRPDDSDPVDLGDRVATAIISGIAAAITLVGYFFLSHSWRASHLGFYLFRDFITLNACKLVIGAAVILGFLLGSTRMAAIFSVFWGTSDK